MINNFVFGVLFRIGVAILEFTLSPGCDIVRLSGYTFVKMCGFWDHVL